MKYPPFRKTSKITFVALAFLLTCGGCGSSGNSDTSGDLPGLPGIHGYPSDQGGNGGTAGGSSGGTAGGGKTTANADCSNGPLAAPINNCKLEPLPSTGDILQDCVNRINQFRRECQCLPPLKRWRGGEACAQKHAQSDSQTGIAHGAFSSGNCVDMSKGRFAQNECPNWGDNQRMVDGCLQMMWDEGPGTGPSHGHYNSMSSTTYTEVACGFANGWGVQNFR